MTEAMRYWVREAGIDGYRVDAAGLTPLDFWEHAAAELRAIKPVFLLAEWESRDMHAKASTPATHGPGGKACAPWPKARPMPPRSIPTTRNQKFYPKQAYRMLYTTNHDKNAWDGTEFEVFGPAVDAVIAFSFVSEGIPLIYNGQEAGNRKRLAFFERDALQWQASPYTALYTKLLAMKKQHSALWNGEWGATMEQVVNDAPKQVFSFVRQNAKTRCSPCLT
jgi:glycosidase